MGIKISHYVSAASFAALMASIASSTPADAQLAPGQVIVVGATPVIAGVNTDVLFDNNGIVGVEPGGGGGGGLPPGGYLDQPLTNAGSSGTGQWGNVLYARSGAPGTVADGTALLLYGEQGFTTGTVGYGAGVTLGGGRHEGDDGSYGGDGILKGGGAGTYGGGYANAFGANSDSGPGGIRMGGGYTLNVATQNTISISGMPQFDPGANESTITLETGFNTYRAGDIDLIANSAADIINGNIKVTLNANTGAAQGNLYLFGLPTAVTDLPDDALWIEPSTGALIAAPGTGTGGGGGAAIEPESGPGLKISAIVTSSAQGMASTALLTGLDAGGANANYTQTQILTGSGDGTFSPSNIALRGGYGGASYGGGYSKLEAGSAMGQPGGNAVVLGGNGAPGGQATFYGGNSTTGDAGAGGIEGGYSSSGRGGNGFLRGGTGSTNGGDVTISPGVGATYGNIIVNYASLVDPEVTNAIWNNNGIPMFSGVANYTGTPDIAGNTLTVVNGIITAATGGGVDVIESDTSIVATSSAVSNIINYSFSASFGAITALTGTAKTMTVTGLLTTDQVYVECISAPPSGYVPPNARVSAPNTLELFFTTSVALGITLGSLNFVLTILR